MGKICAVEFIIYPPLISLSFFVIRDFYIFEKMKLANLAIVRTAGYEYRISQTNDNNFAYGLTSSCGSMAERFIGGAVTNWGVKICDIVIN